MNGRIEDISHPNTFLQGSCKEHVLPEEGDQGGGSRKATLTTQVGVTHVLNTAEGQQSGTVDTNEKFYK